MRVFLVAALWAAFITSTLAAEQGRLTIYTVNYPLHYFAQRIAGEHADVVFPAPAGVDPAFWQPAVEIISGYQQADLVLLNGAGYAKWIDRVSLPRRKLVDTSATFRDMYIHVNEGVTHSHGPAGDHSHTGTAFTTWLDFNQAAGQSRVITEALTGMRPEWTEDFEHNLALLKDDLLKLDKQIETIVTANPDRPLVASHPVYQYLQRRYGLNLVSVMWEPDEVPGEVQWMGLERTLKKHPARWMIWESNPNPGIVERLRAMDVESIVFDPAGNRPNKGDYLSVMRQNVKNLQRVFK